LSVLVRFFTAAVAVWVLREGIAGSPAVPPVWLMGIASFGLVKLVGDLGLLAFFRHSVVIFYEDMFWELLAFLLLGALAGGLILAAQSFIGGEVEPYLPALGVYLVFLIVESRQSGERDRG
jgi:hypothetical protein